VVVLFHERRKAGGTVKKNKNVKPFLLFFQEKNKKNNNLCSWRLVPTQITAGVQRAISSIMVPVVLRLVGPL